jgi:hypothetical protein
MNKKQPLLNLTNILDCTTKNVEKKKKKKDQKILILKHFIKLFKTSGFYYYKVVA